jgi:cobalamin biosynthesis protein CobD/CbiB
LVLGIRLGKPGVYVLNEEGVPPTREHHVQALFQCWIAAAMGIFAMAGLRGFGVRW